MMREAAILAGLIEAGESLSFNQEAKCGLILQEMRAESETTRLARRIAWAFGLPDPIPDPKNA
jgi:hypothetical protein